MPQDPQTPEELVFPEDFSALSDAEVSDLLSASESAFRDVYGDGQNLSDEQYETLGTLTEGINATRGEKEARDAAAAQRAADAAALAEQAGVTLSTDDDEEIDADDEAPAEGDAPEDSTEDVDADAEAADAEGVLVASGTGERRVSLRNVRRPRSPKPVTEKAPADRYGNRSIRDIVHAAPGVPGLQSGQGTDWLSLATAVDRRLQSFPKSAYDRANRQGKRLRETHALAVISKPQDPLLTITSSDEQHVAEVIAHAQSEKRLTGGTLLASGGWCAPSETIYDLCELESRDGLLSVPEVTIARGGLNFTQGPNFAEIYASTGFCYTEEEDIAGDYDGEGGGEKPCFHIPCPEFQDERMDLCGLCLTAGLLQSRGYPEAIARFLRGALVAHDHRLNANFIQRMVDGSDSVIMPSPQVGATAPLLTAIELQVEHLRTVNRMSRSVTLEGIFPAWVHGVVRSDLSRRLGVDFLDVSNQRINAWFAQRGVAPQFVYDWQDISTTPASGFTQWPATVDFLLYPAGTWLKGARDIITMDNIYDSTGLGTNDYTALFTEEGWMAAKLCHDSRVVTVSICPSGATGAGVDIACDGTGTEE